MNLGEYFENASGYGVLATANSAGKVDAAIYARPHFMEENKLAFIMAERLTYENLKTNPHAAYLFIESAKGYSGKRLFLTMKGESTDEDLISEICRRCDYSIFGENLTRHVVFFDIDSVLPLIGSATPGWS